MKKAKVKRKAKPLRVKGWWHCTDNYFYVGARGCSKCKPVWQTTTITPRRVKK